MLHLPTRELLFVLPPRCSAVVLILPSGLLLFLGVVVITLQQLDPGRTEVRIVARAPCGIVLNYRRV